MPRYGIGPRHLGFLGEYAGIRYDYWPRDAAMPSDTVFLAVETKDDGGRRQETKDALEHITGFFNPASWDDLWIGYEPTGGKSHLLRLTGASGTPSGVPSDPRVVRYVQIPKDKAEEIYFQQNEEATRQWFRLNVPGLLPPPLPGSSSGLLMPIAVVVAAAVFLGGTD